MVFKTADGVEVIKTFNFTEGEYPVVVNHKVVNRSGQTWQGQMFGQIKRDNSEDPGKSDQVSSPWERSWAALGVHRMKTTTS